jgi:spore coat protein U-like protein
MKTLRIQTLLLLSGLSFWSATSFAATNTSSFNVKIEVISACNLDTINDVDFGTVSAASFPTADLTQTTVLNVSCNIGTPYSVALTPSSGNTDGTGEMTTGASAIPYELFSNSTHTQPWGDVDGTNTVTGTAIGSYQPLTVYAKVPIATISPLTLETGVYTDTVTVTLTY